MFNIATIESGLSGLVGFSQRVGKSVDRLDADLTTSVAGSFIDQSAHPLLSLENIFLCMDTWRKNDVSAWDDSIEYNTSDVVLKNNKVWQAKQAGTNKDPETEAAYWTETNLISAFLRNLRRKAASNLFESVFSERQLHKAGKTLLTDTSLYDATGSLSNLVSNLGRFVGYRIRPKYKDTVITIKSIGLQLKTVAPEFKIYVYQNASNEALREIDINHDKAVTFGWHELAAGIQLPFNSNSINDAGVFFIGYYQEDLPDGCNAIWKEMQWNNCSTCDTLNAFLYRQWNNFFDLQPMYIENTWLNEDRTMFPMDKQMLLANQNWGMNMKIQVECDLSDFIVRNKMSFVKGLKTQIIHDLLNLMAYSDRENGRIEKLSPKAQFALSPTKDEKEPGYVKRLENEIKNINFEMSDLNSVCLPCVKAASGVKTKSVFK